MYLVHPHTEVKRSKQSERQKLVEAAGNRVVMDNNARLARLDKKEKIKRA